MWFQRYQKKMEVQQATKTAFMQYMKTKIGPDEEISAHLLDMIKNSLWTLQENAIPQLPIYDQLHQVNVCVICDRYITGTKICTGSKKHITFSSCQVKSPQFEWSAETVLPSDWSRFTSFTAISKSKSKEKWWLFVLLSVWKSFEE